MKLLVLSDTHGRIDVISRVLKMHSDADAILFLGDGISDMIRCLDNTERLYCVRGNCDGNTFSQNIYAPKELLITFGEYNILMMHGYNYGVKGTLTHALKYAAQREADVLLYGHTHIALEKYFPSDTDIDGVKLKKPLYAFNPGSLYSSYGGEASYGLIQIKNKNILFSHGLI